MIRPSNKSKAKKWSQMLTEEYFRTRAQRADRDETLRILRRAAMRNRPVAGDELPRASALSQIKPTRRRKK